MDNYNDHGAYKAGQVAILESKVQAISLLEARVRKLEDKNLALRGLLEQAICSDCSHHVMGEQWHEDARGVV